MGAAVRRCLRRPLHRPVGRGRADELLRHRRRAPPQRHRPADHVGHATAATGSVPDAMAVIRVEQLRKRYADTWAVDDLSFSGRRRARSTRCSVRTAPASRRRSRSSKVTGRRRRAPWRCSRAIPWNAGREFRDRIGIVLQSSGVETEFTVREVIELYGGCYRSPRPLDEVVGLVGLDEKVDAADRFACRAASADVSIWRSGSSVVPTCCSSTNRRPGSTRPPGVGRGISSSRSGLDGTTVLLTTHYLDEAEHLADRVGVLSAGRMIAEGTPEELINRSSGTVVSFMLPESVAVGRCRIGRSRRCSVPMSASPAGSSNRRSTSPRRRCTG